MSTDVQTAIRARCQDRLGPANRAEDVSAAPRVGFVRAAADGPRFMTVTLSSSCPEEG